MKTISDYSIYCTPSQTKKALELGAPLFRLYGTGSSDYIDMLIISDTEAYTIPTAEQMIGWLEEQSNIYSIEVDIEHNYPSSAHTWRYFIYDWENDDIVASDDKFNSRKEATLAAIDAALEYLTDNKK